MNTSEILIYQATDGKIKIDVRLEDETVWLTQDHMAGLFGKAKSTINEHIKNIFAEGELVEVDVMKKFGISEFQQKAPNYSNLDVIISVGSRVKSHQGTQFRIWATQRLKEYIVKGFALNDERFKTGNSMVYFTELQNAFAKSAFPSASSIRKSRISIPPASTTTPRTKRPSSFSRWFRTSSSGPSAGKRRRNWYIAGRTPRCP
jgi:hypothetical protein